MTPFLRLPAVVVLGLVAGTAAAQTRDPATGDPSGSPSTGLPQASPSANPPRGPTADGPREEPPRSPALPSAARFAGWSDLRDDTWTFDPDDRPVLGYSVHATPAARAALEEADSALAAGDAPRAARLYAAMVGANADEVIPVAGVPPRWVGAGEWALYELLTRVPESARAAIESPEQRRAVAEAIAWRDLPALRRLAWMLEGTGEGLRATALAARLLAESGANDAARAAAERALVQRPDDALAAFRARLPATAAPEAVCGSELPAGRLDPVWTSPLPIARQAKNNPFLLWRDPGEAPIAPIVPVVRDGVIYLTDSLSVSALDLYSGHRLWHHAGPLEEIGDNDPTGRWFGLDTYVDSQRERAISPFQLASPTVTAELVVTTEQVLERRHELPRFDTIPIGWPLPWRRLVALDRATGALRWSQERPEAGPDDFRNAFNVAGPPAVADGVVFAAGSVSQGAINSYVAAFDLATGELLWRTLLCAGQQDLTMFNRPFQEHTASPPLVADGSVYVCTNLGVAGCLDAWSGRIRWLTGYESTVRRPSRSPEHDQRRDVHWLNDPPLLVGGRLLVTPLDSGKLFAYDPGTGRTLWSLDSRELGGEGSRHQLLASASGAVLLLGDERLERLDIVRGSVAGSLTIVPPEGSDGLTGRATVCGERVLVPLESKLLVCDAGALRVVEQSEWPRRPYPVRMAQVADAVLLATDNDSLFAAVDLERALDELASRASGSPEALLRFAELSLSAGHLAEAEAGFDALIESETGAWRERAVSGRIKASLDGARLQDDVEHWTGVLQVALRLGDVWSVAPEALESLDDLGAAEAVEAWLGTLAALDAGRRIDLGRLTPQGSQPAGLVLALRQLPADEPGAAVARLQEMLESWPDESWDGRPVREQAARRIGELLEAHGHELYARFDQAAERELAAAGGDADAAAAVAARYPHARAVEQARLARDEALLAAGKGRDLLEELAVSSGSPSGATLAALRARAARQVGEAALADALEGRPAPVELARLPALPAADAQVSTVEVSSGGTVHFADLDGVSDAPFDTMALGTVTGSGELFLLDSATSRLVWRRSMPGQLPYPSTKDADFLRSDGRLFAEVTGRRAGDVLEAISLADGASLWSRVLSGRKRSTLLADGLVLRLTLESQGAARQFRLDGFGQVTGVHVLSLDLPPCQSARLHRAGAHVVVYSVGSTLNDGTPQDVRLWTLDLRAGELRAHPAPPVASPWVVAALQDPPCLLLAQRRPPPVLATWLGGWNPETGATEWSVDVPTDTVDQHSLLEAGPGRAVLLCATPVASGPEPMRLLSIDSRAGLRATVDAGLGLEPLAGREGPVPRLVLLDTVDGARLVVADATSGELRFELRLPAAAPGAPRRSPLDELSVVQGRDGFVLADLPTSSSLPTTLRVVDGESGRERYSVVLDPLSQNGRRDLAAVEGALLLAQGGSVRIVRSPQR